MKYHTWILPVCLVVLELSYAADIYTHTWAVHIEGGPEVAKEIAHKYGFTYLDQIMPDYHHFAHNRVSKRSVYTSDEHHNLLAGDPQVKWLEQQKVKKRVKRGDYSYNDPKWPRMWYLNRPVDGLNMNVKPAWEQGITGRGVAVTILDDGIEKDHPDLKKNYDPQASWDVNGRDADPQPRYDYTNQNRHGTRCAGEVAAEANNRICSVGVAYNARIGGVRMLDGDVTDAVEAQSLSLHPQHIDIYSASWGPDDDGRTVDGPALLATKAFLDGIKYGRGGKGSIFVWASGNGGRDGDSCNCDGYTNSIYTLSISSVTEKGNIPWYSESCSSTLATTYSSGAAGERQIVTTDLRKGCTEAHTGTSASAPLAAGICALALEANPSMSWRDMQHIVVRTARPEKLSANDWVTNGINRKVSHSFGYGLMDAAAMVNLARNWTNVPDQHRCEIRANIAPRGVPVYNRIRVTLESNGCDRDPQHKVHYLEHVQSLITLTSSRRGELQIFLTSPQGTKSTLLQKRAKDSSLEGFNNWAFMTTHSWGEISKGTWMLEVENADSTSELRAWTLVMYGTASHPEGVNELKRFQQDNRMTDELGSTMTTTSEEVTGKIPVITITAEPYEEVTGKIPVTNTAPEPYDSGSLCEDGQFFLNNFCYEQCPSNFFAHEIQVNVTSNITQNSTQDSEESTTKEGTAATAQDGTGVIQVQRNICIQCHFLCLECVGAESDQCTSCANGYKFANSTCYQVEQPETAKKKRTVMMVVLIVSLCAVACLVFITVFLILQARSGQLCVKGNDLRPRRELMSKSGYSIVQLQSSDRALLDSDTEDEDIYDQNREKFDLSPSRL